MQRLHEAAAAFGLALAGVLFAGGALEIGVRVLRLEPDRFWRADPVLGTRLIPGKVGWWTQEDREFVTRVRINSEGLRDVEHAYAKPPGTFRILVLGDSFAEALQVPLEQSFPRILEGELNRAVGTRVEVINGGVSGYGTAAELLFFRTEGIRYRPDLVLLAFYPGNDVMNNSPDLEDTLIPVFREDGELVRMRAAGKPRKAVGGAKRLLARSRAYRYVRRTVLSGHPEMAARLVRLGLLDPRAIPKRAVQDGIPTAYGVYGPPEAKWEDAWRRTALLIGELQREVGRAGARLAVAIVPSKEEVYPDWWEDVLNAHPAMQERQWNLDGPRERVLRICAEAGLPCLALARAFRAQRKTPPLYFYRDGHWTAAGHRLAAQEIASFLLATGLLPAKNGGEENGFR